MEVAQHTALDYVLELLAALGSELGGLMEADPPHRRPVRTRHRARRGGVQLLPAHSAVPVCGDQSSNQGRRGCSASSILGAVKGNWLAAWLRLQIRLARVREDLV
jgi:hypothetical protein